MRDLLGARGLAVIAWLSALAMIWLFVLRVIPFNLSNMAFWFFFFAVALMSSAEASRQKR